MNIFHNYPYTDFHELNLDWCIENIKKLLAYFEGLDRLATVEYVDEEIRKTKEEIRKAEETLQALIDLKVDKTTFNEFVSEVQISLESIAGNIRTLQLAVADNAQAIIDTYNNLKNYIDSQLIDLEVINPMTGQTQPIQLVLNYMADLLRSDALTAQEYDSAELTAEDYDGLELTAYVYDNYGRNYITP